MEDKIIDISVNIMDELGTGFNEVVYQNALKVDLRKLGINYEYEVVIPIIYKNHNVGYGRADIIIKDNENYKYSEPPRENQRENFCRNA